MPQARLHQLAYTFSLGLFALWLAGCAMALGKGATYSYFPGELEQEYPTSLDRTYAATLTVLKRMELQVTEQKKDQLGASIWARRSDETPVVVKLKALGSGKIRLTIRVGTFGDRDASIRINNEIRHALGM